MSQNELDRQERERQARIRQELRDSGLRVRGEVECKSCGNLTTEEDALCIECKEARTQFRVCDRCGAKTEAERPYCENCGVKS